MSSHNADVQDFVDSLAEDLERAIVVEDRRHALISHSSHWGEVDTVRARTVISRQTPAEAIAWVTEEGLLRAREPIRLKPNPELGAVSRIAMPIRADDRIIGFLAVLDPDQSLTAEGFERCSEAAGVLAGLMQELWSGRDRGRLRERELVATLVEAEEPEARREAGRSLFRATPVKGARFCVIVVRSQGSERSSVADEHAKLVRRAFSARSFVLSEFDSDLVLIFSVEVDARLTADTVPEVIDGGIAPGDRGPAPIVALGDCVADLAEIQRSYRHACLAAQVSERMPDPTQQVVEWSRLGAFQVLVHLPDSELGKGQTDNQLLVLADRPELLETLEVYLDLAGDAGKSARSLHLHRASLYYRLDKITELTGLDLKSGSDRLAAHLSIKALRMAGLFGPGAGEPGSH